MVRDIWHYPRRELADKTLKALTAGPAKALLLFGPRRIGKTEFLRKDIAPLASKRGHAVVYASFWQSPQAPVAVLVDAIKRSLAGESLAGALIDAAGSAKGGLKLSAPLGAGAASVEVGVEKVKDAAPAERLLALDKLIERIARPGKPAILLLDEVQELAKDDSNAALIASMRTSFDKQSNGVRVIFTGSSQQGLRRMFSARSAPFFHFATEIDLPRLGAPFVDHMIEAFYKASSRRLDRRDMVAVFEDLDANPHLFRLILDELLSYPDLKPKAALARLRGRLYAALGFDEIWGRLNSLQRAVAVALAEGVERPYSEESLRILARLTGDKALTTGRVQTALKKLAREDVVSSIDGRWAIADPTFLRFALAKSRPG
jgi:hypothetical protein